MNLSKMSYNKQNMKELTPLYSQPLPSSRSGVLFSAFSYPTKISPESIAVFIASHTKPGDTILDVFGGAGTTGLATRLCSNPTEEMLALAKKTNAQVIWGARRAIVYELSTIGALVAETMCNPPNENDFLKAANELISLCEEDLANIYLAKDSEGKKGFIRYIIWSDVYKCNNCSKEFVFGDVAVHYNPLSIKSSYRCPHCKKTSDTNKTKRVYENYYDVLLKKRLKRPKRVPWRVYGQTKNRKWSRRAKKNDVLIAKKATKRGFPTQHVPIKAIPWGDLYRAGYHKGITHVHHFYTHRNLLIMASIWKMVEKYKPELQNALKVLLLSYNAAHATLMTRVVVKSGKKDLVLTGAQPGVLYISNLPVEKNIFEGLRRKAKIISKAFSIINRTQGSVKVVNGSSRKLAIPDNSVDYVFTDPPFGDFIPYAEINYLNEAWLKSATDRAEEIVVSVSQNKSVDKYGKMMGEVFKEMARTLKYNGLATIVFHSSKDVIWRAFQRAVDDAGFSVKLTSILDKKQETFKQVNSKVSVKGDPLFLLTKETHVGQKVMDDTQVSKLFSMVIHQSVLYECPDEYSSERIYSRFISRCLEQNVMVPMCATEFYHKVDGIRCINK